MRIGAAVKRYVSLLAIGHVVLCGALLALGGRETLRFGKPAWVVALGAAFGLVSLLRMRVEIGRAACTFTLVEAVVVVALFAVGPLGVAALATVGEAVASIAHREPSTRACYNAASAGFAAAIAALGFAALAGTHHDTTLAWGAALLAVGCFATCKHASASLVLSVSGAGPFEEVFVLSLGMAAVASLVSGSIGLAAEALGRQSPWAPGVLVPLVGLVVLATRRTAAQRTEHLRFERLFAASSRITGLQGFEAAMSQAASEARSLVSGAVAVCCTPDRDGAWRGMVVDDTGPRAAEPRFVGAVVALMTRHSGTETLMEDVDPSMRDALPSAASVVVAGTPMTSSPQSSSGIALAVFRDTAGDGEGETRAKVLWAFVFHAALITTNALLFDRVEEALRQQVDLNRQKDEFLAAVSHELRTPLASMLGSVDTLCRLEGRLDAEARERFLQIAQRQGKRLQRLIEELLLTAAVEHRRELCVAEEVNLDELFMEVAEDLAAQAEGRLVVRVDPHASHLRTDGHKLRQVIINLVENATKYAPQGAIELSAVAGGAGDGERVLVRVVDHGPGISPEDRARVFERFVQLDGSSTRSRGGTGLGLYLCAKVAELLGAALYLGDTPGGGATFALSLPRQPSPAASLKSGRPMGERPLNPDASVDASSGLLASSGALFTPTNPIPFVAIGNSG